MTPPKHYAHLYQRPKQGSVFLKRYEAYNYTHSISAKGWFDTAAFDVAVRSDAEGQKAMDQYIGAGVAIFVDNPLQPIWEGLVNRITFNSGGASYTISLDEMANRVSVVTTGAANVAAQTTVVNNTASQAIFGIKQEQIEGGADPSAATIKTTLRDTLLAQKAYPQTAITQAQGNQNIIRFECIGYYHTLEWAKFFTATSTSTSAMGTNVATIIGADPNGTTFYNNADVTQISANAVTIQDQERGSSFWERLLKIAEAGDGTNNWVCGIQPRTKQTLRRFYYRVANYEVEYTTRKADALQPRNEWGRKIPPWLVVPDRVIRVTDALVGYGGALVSDPTETYIQSVQYDANSQIVQWFGFDDTTARAAYRLNRGYKPLSSPFGAPLRTIVT